MRNLQVFSLVAMALMVFMAGATELARRARQRRVGALQAAGDDEGGHVDPAEHTS